MDDRSSHRPLRGAAATAVCCLVIGLSGILAAVQLAGVARRLHAWQGRQEPALAFGQADLVYFSEPTCPACQEASPHVAALERRYPRYRFAHVDAGTDAGDALQQQYYRAYHVPKRDQGYIPILFAGRRYFLGTQAIEKQLPAYLAAGPQPAPRSRSSRATRYILVKRRDAAR